MAENRLGILWFVLDAPSSERLRKAVPALYPKHYYHHVTLLYGIGRETVASLIGQTHDIEAYAVAHNNQAQAVRVRAQDLPDTYGVPHVTLSTAQGVPPYESVAMLEGEHTEAPLNPPIVLSGTVQFEYLDTVAD